MADAVEGTGYLPLELRQVPPPIPPPPNSSGMGILSLPSLRLCTISICHKLHNHNEFEFDR